MEKNEEIDQILKRIKAIRKQRGYSLENMAAEIGIHSDTAYRKVENHETTLSLERFLKIAKALDVSENELLGLKPQREYHQYNNEKGTFIGHQEYASYYQENKEITAKLISSLETNIKYLQEENALLRSQLSNEQAV